MISIALVTDSGSSIKIKQGEDGTSYLKIKVQIDEPHLSAEKLMIIAKLIERVEKDDIERGKFYKFWKDVKKFSVRYLVGNSVGAVFNIITILLSMKFGGFFK